ncbi:helix-turn-helix transcriptional regulator [Kitasatospora sp. NPDC052896]|uniref:helix-turn-helix transcriptional regulator n=1 Tax=Kitasatospora sp. NPDC052896 TaxID=3364061 RepID=UPI0037C91994
MSVIEAAGAAEDPADSLGDQLRYWRGRLDPQRIPGLVRDGRRSPGLSQREVARLTGVSDRWYRELELGRQANFSEDFLDRLAFTLRLSDAERHILYLRAIGRPPAPRGGADAKAIQALDGPMQRLLDSQLPHPAYLSDEAWTIFGHNKPQADWFPWIPYEPNLMRWAFLYPEARDQLVNWRDDWARPFLAQIRFACLQLPESEPLKQLKRDILKGNPEAREIWDRHEVVEHPDGHERRLRLPYHGDQEVAVNIMALAPLRSSTTRFIVLQVAD